MDDLRKLAEAATPGPWRFADNGFDRYIVGGPVWMRDDDVEWGTPVFGGEPHEGAVDEDDPNVRYVCAASPDVIIALLDRAERAERERDEERHIATVRGEMLTKCERERDEARAALVLRPEITPEDAAAVVDTLAGLVRVDGSEWEAGKPIVEALRTHAAKVTR